MKNFKTRLKFKKYISGKSVFIFSFIAVFLFVNFITFIVFKNTINAQIAVSTSDIINQKLNAGQGETLFENFTWEKAWAELKDKWQQLAGAAFKKAVGVFTRQFAYDMANFLSSGNEGQKPMFYTDGWGAYLKNTADKAAGTFLEEYGKSSPVAFNLCNPNIGARIQIGLGMAEKFNPSKPDCTFTQMLNNWDAELSNPDFLNNFQKMFDVRANDLGIALSLYTGVEYQASQAAQQAILERTSGQGMMDVKTAIGDYIKTPASTLLAMQGVALKDSTSQQLTWTGTAADAIDVFINTLVGNLIQKWLREGLVNEFPDNSYQGGLYNYNSAPSTGGTQGAKNRFRTLIEPEFGARGDYNVLTELVNCPDPTNAGPTNCVITDNFRHAVSEELTVGEAMDQGYLNPNGVFGFSAPGLEPNYNEGYPYRSMAILRKFRIIPVGWELAAQYINDCIGESDNKACEQGANRVNVDSAQSLRDMVNCFDPNDDYGPGTTPEWCRGLVDPSWVLKAPQNYCRREGPGPVIQSSQVTGQGDSSKLVVTRADDYCADEQACIKESGDGSCQAYGYCTEEKRSWNFRGQSCEPVYNTCQTFRDPAGQTMSYLENTLDYENCSSANAGCTGYCADYDYSLQDYTCAAPTDHYLYLDRDANACEASNEGCHEFIRLKPGNGANILVNSDFEDYNGSPDDSTNDVFAYWATLPTPVTGEATALNPYRGDTSLILKSDISATITVGAPGFLIGGEAYSLSFYARDCQTDDSFQIVGQTDPTPLKATAEWVLYSTSHIFPVTTGGNQVGFTISLGGSGTCVIDAIKLERGAQYTAYSDYRANGLVYQKLAPDYLACDGQNDPAECSQYVRSCGPQDVGCNLFTGIHDGISVPARITPEDSCPAECSGYDEYLQTAASFASEKAEYFIPATARSCSANAVGCDEFTNLDALGQGAEEKEYYKNLKQCVDNSNPAAASTDIANRYGSGIACSELYTWEGSAESGYQLRVHDLLLQGNTPVLTSAGQYNGQDCNASTFNIATNPMCWEFYDTTGNVHYAFFPYLVTCSDNCHPYRRTMKNAEPDIATAQADCQAECGTTPNCASLCSNSGSCSGSDNQRVCAMDDGTAVFCKNGGYWRSDQQACIYHAVPNEGISCSEGSAGCREYSGPQGRNTRQVFSSNFEGSRGDWAGNVSLSNESLMVGGESLLVNGIAQRPVAGILTAGRTYSIRFIAKADSGNVNLSVSLTGSNGSHAFGGQAALDDVNWRLVEMTLDPPALGHVPAGDETLTIDGGGQPFYIDDVYLYEIVDRYYLVEDSWQTPDSCFYDVAGTYRGPTFNLGCDQYRDQENENYYLNGFSRLCSEDVVGCEVMIDTQNSLDWQAKNYNDNGDGSCLGDEPDCITVPADDFSFVVYNSSKMCQAADKGCQRLGDPYIYGSDTVYGDIFLENDPDKYPNSLCQAEESRCQEWTTGEGTEYFKDPGSEACEYKQFADGEERYTDWIKLPVKRCDTNGDSVINAGGENYLNRSPLEPAICQDSGDCPDGINCVVDTNYYICPQNTVKTFGYGEQGKGINQPIGPATNEYWAGLCPAADVGCSEYIDPVSRFSVNSAFNSDFTGDFQQIVTPGWPDGWDAVGADGVQTIEVNGFTLYRLAAYDVADPVTLDCTAEMSPGSLWIITENNTRGLPPADDIVVLDPGQASVLIYAAETGNCTLRIGSLAGNLGSGRVEFKPVIISYQLAGEVDKTGCNGLVNFEDGCILFDERRQEGAVKSRLIYDADLTIDDQNGIFPKAGILPADNDSNALIKVEADRECSEWLACRSYGRDQQGNNVCYDLGLCNSFNSNLGCDNFLITTPEPSANDQERYLTGDQEFANKTGYVRAGWWDNTLEADYFPLADMDQVGETANVPNGNFESFEADNAPIGWLPVASTSQVMSWSPNLFRTVSNPVAAQDEGVPYPAEGGSFLKFSPSAGIMESEFIDVEPGAEYSLSALMNSLNFKPNTGFFDAVAKIKIETYDSFGKKSLNGTDFAACDGNPAYKQTGCWIEIGGAQNEWQRIARNFKVGNSTHRIKLIIEGEVLFDDNAGAQLCCDRAGGAGVCDDEDNDFSYYPSVSCVSRGSIFYDSGTAPLGCRNGHQNTVDIDSDSCFGNVYIDDIQIQPVINYRYGQNIPQTCRLYPQTDSLACEYFEDSGVMQKGWPGYCLEYDHFPGSSDACIMWYPVDRVKGDGIEEGAGYADRMPLYYTSDMQVIRAQTAPRISHNFHADFENKFFSINEFNFPDPIMKELLQSGALQVNGNFVVHAKCRNGTITLNQGNDWQAGCHGGKCGLTDLTFQQLYDTWFRLGDSCEKGGENGNTSRIAGIRAVFKPGTMIFEGLDAYVCHSDTNEDDGTTISDIYMELEVDYSQKLVQVVTPTGQNKFWSGRVYEGSDFLAQCPDGSNLCGFMADYRPFGAAVSPLPVSNPYDWDSKPNTPGIQPLFYEPANTGLQAPYQPRSGQSYLSTELEHLYAQSYGTWTWTAAGGTCQNNLAPCPNGHDCPGGECIVSPDLVCTNGAYLGYTCDACGGSCAELVVDDIKTCGGIVGPDAVVCAGDAECPSDNPCLVASQPTCDGDIHSNPCCGTASETCAAGQTVCNTPSLNAGQFCDTGHNDCPGSICSGAEGHYDRDITSPDDWGPPPDICAGNRPAYPGDLCSILPQVKNIKINSTNANLTIKDGDAVTLTFSSQVDSQQLPLVLYAVDWGDGEKTVVSGAEMRDRQDPDNPHTLYHIFSFWDMVAKEKSGVLPAGTCDLSAKRCSAKPGVKIKDNWGWCNTGWENGDFSGHRYHPPKLL